MSPGRREQSRAAFEEFVAGSTASLLRTAYLVTGDAGHAEDLVQESLFKIARNWSRVVTMDSPGRVCPPDPHQRGPGRFQTTLASSR